MAGPAGDPGFHCSEAALNTDFTAVGFEPIYLSHTLPAVGKAPFVGAGIAPSEAESLAFHTNEGTEPVDLFDDGFFVFASASDATGFDLQLDDGRTISCEIHGEFASVSDCSQSGGP